MKSIDEYDRRNERDLNILLKLCIGLLVLAGIMIVYSIVAFATGC